MNLRFILFATIFIFISISSYSQYTIDYSPLKCEGIIPEDFLELSSAKVKLDQEIINSGKLSKKEKAYQKEFSVNTNYGVDQILLSGQVLYGDPLTSYINRLADIILKDDPSLRKELRFYTIKSDFPNAFTTNQGIIFVSVGLMAQVENEAQLAYILCHEIIHYTQKHNYLSFKKVKKIQKKSGKYTRSELKDKLKQLYNYSKIHELEADKKGFELFQKTQYNSKAAIASFDMLLYSYLPFEEIEWKPNYFEDSFFVFPKKLTLRQVQELSADASEDDEKQTHPNVSKRKNALMEIADTNDSKTNLYLTKEGDFETIQHMARIEVAFLYIIQGAFESAIYHAYLLEKKYNDKLFANRIKAMALYGTYKHKLAKDKFEFGDYSDCEGESQRVYYLLNTLKAQDITVLASREIWKYYLDNKNDSFLKRLAYESLSDVFAKARMERSNFVKTYKTKSEEEIVDSNKKETKIEKLKKRKKKQLENNSDTTKYSQNYLSTAYITLYRNTEFQKAIKQLSNIRETWKEDSVVKKKPFAKLLAKIKKEKKTHITKGFDTLLMFNPSYTGPENKSGLRDMSGEEKREIYLAKMYKEMASENQIHLNMFNTLDKENLNTEYWNTYMVLNQWLTERLNNDTITMNLYFKEYVSVLYKTYRTNYFSISGINYLGGAGYNLKGNFGDGFFNRGRANVIYFMAVFDTNTSRLEFLEYQGFISRMRPSFLKGLVYSSFYELKLKQKK